MPSNTRPHGKGQDTVQMSNIASLTLVRSFLNAAVGTIAHTRELIPWNSSCFQDYQANELNIGSDHIDGVFRGVRIENTMGSSQPEEDARTKHPSADGISSESKSQKFRILRRGKNERADAILDMLDGGVADALNQSYLKAFQLIIVADATDPASTLESYTFAFAYNDGAVSQIDVSSGENAPFSVGSLHRSFGRSIKSLLKSMAGLPRLPRHRSLGFALLYNDGCPQNYRPAGFVDPNKNNQLPLRGCWTDLWQDLPSTIADLSAGCHEIAISARNLQYHGPMHCTRLQDILVSNEIRELQKTSSRDPDITSTVAELPSSRDHTSTNIPRDGLYEVNVAPTHTRSNTGQAQRRRVRVSAGATASVSIVNTLSKATVASRSRRRRNVFAGKIAELIVQARAVENAHRGPERLFDQKKLVEGKVRILNRSGPVQCECSSQHEATNMLCCELCGTKQHRSCYGWEALRSGSLPFDHFCYNCLLLPREHKTCSSMSVVVQMRRALQILAEEPSAHVQIGDGFRRAIFPDSVDSEMAFAKLIERLEEEDFIRRNDDGTAQIVEITERRLPAIQEKYLDPLASVGHHYQIVRDGDTPAKRKEEVTRELRLYAGERAFSHDDRTNSHYDRVHVHNNIGQEVIRWGFYANWKKRKISSDETAQPWQKIGVSNKFVNVDNSTPNETLSFDEVMHEAVNEAQWTMRLSRRFASASSDDH